MCLPEKSWCGRTGTGPGEGGGRMMMSRLFLAVDSPAYFPTHTSTTSIFLSFLHIGCRYSA